MSRGYISLRHEIVICVSRTCSKVYSRLELNLNSRNLNLLLPGNEVAPQAVMGLFGGTQIETNKEEFSAECHSVDWFNRTTDSNKIEVIVLDDQKSRELRRI